VPYYAQALLWDSSAPVSIPIPETGEEAVVAGPNGVQVATRSAALARTLAHNSGCEDERLMLG